MKSAFSSERNIIILNILTIGVPIASRYMLLLQFLSLRTCYVSFKYCTTLRCRRSRRNEPPFSLNVYISTWYYVALSLISAPLQ